MPNGTEIKKSHSKSSAKKRDAVEKKETWKRVQDDGRNKGSRTVPDAKAKIKRHRKRQYGAGSRQTARQKTSIRVDLSSVKRKAGRTA
jgi:hypothetical protein